MRPSSRLLALVAPFAGCGLFHPSDAALGQQVEEHLAARYGQPFEVEIRSRPLIVMTPGGRAPNLRSFRAAPVGEPHREVRGSVDLGVSPPEIRDDYACVRAEEWLVPALEGALGRSARLLAVDLQCAPYAGPGVLAPVDQPLPRGFTTLYAEVAAFDEGHPIDVATQACAAYRAEAERFGVRPRGLCGAYPAGLADAPAALDRLRGDEPVEDISGMLLAEVQVEPANAPPREFPRQPAVEDAHVDAVRAALPGAEVVVRARPRDPRHPDAALRVDVRIAADGLDLPTMEALAEALRPLPGRLGRALRGVDRASPGAPQRRAFVCRARGCEEVPPPLLDPLVLLEP